MGYEIYFWHTVSDVEVDFIIYGKKGLHAIEIKRSRKVETKMLRGLKMFKQDYPEAKLYLAYTGHDHLFLDDVKIIPISDLLKNLSKLLAE